MDLIADIGGTNSRCALIDADGDTVCQDSFVNASYPGLEHVLLEFVQSECPTAPTRAVLAIAAPIDGDDVTMTNIGWRFSQAKLQRTLDLEHLEILNDFEALAYALPKLESEQTHRIGGGRAVAGANMAVLGPGSGLGVAALTRCGDDWAAVGGEGGHVSVPALTELESRIVAEYADDSGHCAAEKLLSGPGLVRIYAALQRFGGQSPSDVVPAEVTGRASAGDTTAEQALDMFFAMLGTVAGNLALTTGARGGVFVAGGIVPRIVELADTSAFRERFVAKGRYRDYLDSIPTAVVMVEHPAFIGLKYRLAHS